MLALYYFMHENKVRLDDVIMILTSLHKLKKSTIYVESIYVESMISNKIQSQSL